MPERLLEADTAGVKKAYEDFDINRPPFRFPSREPAYQPNPDYSEVDETAIFEMEYKIFHPEECFPHPPQNLAEGHPVLETWKKLLKAREEFMAGVEMIKSVKTHLKSGGGESEKDQVQKTLSVIDPGGRGGLERLERTLREKHLEEKKAYFQRAMCYLQLYKACPHFEEKDPSA